jgi:NAD(P)-dependent dehydrogenase (short-subunit alcohol dehydrogenase family)
MTTALVEHAGANVPSASASIANGLTAATKSLAIEYARNGIRVNAVTGEILHVDDGQSASH